MKDYWKIDYLIYLYVYKCLKDLFWITYLNNFRHKLFYFLNDFGTGARYRWYRSPELLSGGRVTRGTGILPRFQGEGYAWNLRINVYPLSILLSFWQRIFYPCKCKSYDWNLVIKQIWFLFFLLYFYPVTPRQHWQHNFGCVGAAEGWQGGVTDQIPGLVCTLPLSV